MMSMESCASRPIRRPTPSRIARPVSSGEEGGPEKTLMILTPRTSATTQSVNVPPVSTPTRIGLLHRKGSDSHGRPGSGPVSCNSLVSSNRKLNRIYPGCCKWKWPERHLGPRGKSSKYGLNLPGGMTFYPGRLPNGKDACAFNEASSGKASGQLVVTGGSDHGRVVGR